MQFTRRRFISGGGALLAAGGTGLLAACQGSATPTSTTAPAAAPAQAPTTVPVIAPATSAVATTVPPPAKPAASVGPSPSPGLAVGPSPSPGPAAVQALPSAVPARPAAAPVAAGAGKQMYQQDPQHTGRSPHAGPRQATLLRRFYASLPQNMPPDPLSPRADYQSSSVIGPDGTIYVANVPGMLFALRNSPGASDQLEVAWRFHPAASSSLHATPALSSDGSTVYLGFASGGFNGPPPRATCMHSRRPQAAPSRGSSGLRISAKRA